jgi:hypothetical protein
LSTISAEEHAAFFLRLEVTGSFSETLVPAKRAHTYKPQDCNTNVISQANVNIIFLLCPDFIAENRTNRKMPNICVYTFPLKINKYHEIN